MTAQYKVKIDVDDSEVDIAQNKLNKLNRTPLEEKMAKRNAADRKTAESMGMSLDQYNTMRSMEQLNKLTNMAKSNVPASVVQYDKQLEKINELINATKKYNTTVSSTPNLKPTPPQQFKKSDIQSPVEVPVIYTKIPPQTVIINIDD